VRLGGGTAPATSRPGGGVHAAHGDERLHRVQMGLLRCKGARTPHAWCKRQSCTLITVNCDLSGIIRTHNESWRDRERQSSGPVAEDCPSWGVCCCKMEVNEVACVCDHKDKRVCRACTCSRSARQGEVAPPGVGTSPPPPLPQAWMAAALEQPDPHCKVGDV
jgi:hypothetical protein